MKSKWNVGDIVYLKSGSRRMTVTQIWNPNNQGYVISTSWVNYNSGQPDRLDDIPEDCFVRKLGRA